MIRLKQYTEVEGDRPNLKEPSYLPNQLTAVYISNLNTVTSFTKILTSNSDQDSLI